MLGGRYQRPPGIRHHSLFFGRVLTGPEAVQDVHAKLLVDIRDRLVSPSAALSLCISFS